MNYRDLGEAKSLADYLSVIRNIRSEFDKKEKLERRFDGSVYWFRGQRKTSWGLTPKIYREEYKGSDEHEIRQLFESQAIQLVLSKLPTSKWEWYFLMQHYGIPTRLLDWTENPLVGLYFALADNNAEEDAAVWVIDPWWLNSKNPKLKQKGVEGPLLHDWEEADDYLRNLEAAYSGKS